MSIHDRPTLARLMAPGRKPIEIHRAVSLEIQRLILREGELERLSIESPNEFGRDLAADQAERVRDRLDRLRTSWRRIGRPHK